MKRFSYILLGFNILFGILALLTLGWMVYSLLDPSFMTHPRMTWQEVFFRGKTPAGIALALFFNTIPLINLFYNLKYLIKRSQGNAVILGLNIYLAYSWINGAVTYGLLLLQYNIPLDWVTLPNLLPFILTALIYLANVVFFCLITPNLLNIFRRLRTFALDIRRQNRQDSNGSSHSQNPL